MNYFRAIFSGIIVWVCVALTFMSLGYIPGIKDSLQQQSIIAGILMPFYAMLGAMIYYQKGNSDHGLKVGLAISATALLLDVLITVPLFEIPNGGSYWIFFTSPLLWMLVTINITTLFIYWRQRVRTRRNTNATDVVHR